MKRWIVPGVPFVLSFCLSLATVGTHPYWQDSGLYLTAIHELGVLYPPGFVLYELLAFLWSKAFFFLDFVLAVHLFSSLCAALAAGAIALAGRDLLRSRGRIFRVTEEDPGELAHLGGILAGVFLACGFTFWSTAIYAKGYSLYYLILALLLWHMIRADESGSRRDFLIVGALIGFAWQAHPSATLTGAALLLFVLVQIKSIGVGTLAAGIGLAAACALGPSLLLLPWFASREPVMMMGAPQGMGSALVYLLSRRFLTVPGVFGFDPVRGGSFAVFLWEEFLGVGLLLVLGGLGLLLLRRRPFLFGLLAWTVPYATVTILFKIEGQHDCWFVAAWMPFYLAIAVAACEVGRRAAGQARVVLLAVGFAGIAWSVLANLSDVSQRGYLRAEQYGRILIENVDRDAILLLHGDDANGIVGYLQRVRGERPDVLSVSANFLGSDGAENWYDELLLRRHPFLSPPAYGPMFAHLPRYKRRDLTTAAFLNVNAECGRSIFCEGYVPLELLRPDYTLIPAGAVWKLAPKSASELDIRYWRFPIEPEQIPAKARRARGQKMVSTTEEFAVEPQHYERRLIDLIVMARFHLAMGLTEKGQFLQAVKLCESILALDPEYGKSPEIVHHYAISLHAAGEDRKAEPALKRSAEISKIPRNRATALFYLGDIARKRGEEADARRWFEQALATPGLDDGTRREIENRIKTR